MTLAIDIRGCPATKKNSGRIIRNKATGNPLILPSAKYCNEYLQQVFIAVQNVPKGLCGRYNVKAIYHMPTRRRVDLVNLHSALHDALVACYVLVDDNINVIASTDGSYVIHDKGNEHTEVEITEAICPMFTIEKGRKKSK